MRYSPTTQCFYPEALNYKKLPNDLVTVPDDEAVAAQNAPQDSIITYQDGHLIITPSGANHA